MTSRVRVLPLMIIVMFLMFSEKALNVWQGASKSILAAGIEFKTAGFERSNPAAGMRLNLQRVQVMDRQIARDYRRVRVRWRKLTKKRRLLEIQIASANERFNYFKSWLSAETFWMRGNSNWKNGKLY